jgi:hypothetical protein
MSHKKAGQKYSIKIVNRSFEGVGKVQIFGNNTNGSKLHAGRN